jgi:hypothetical protein
MRVPPGRTHAEGRGGHSTSKNPHVATKSLWRQPRNRSWARLQREPGGHGQRRRKVNHLDASTCLHRAYTSAHGEVERPVLLSSEPFASSTLRDRLAPGSRRSWRRDEIPPDLRHPRPRPRRVARRPAVAGRGRRDDHLDRGAVRHRRDHAPRRRPGPPQRGPAGTGRWMRACGEPTPGANFGIMEYRRSIAMIVQTEHGRALRPDGRFVVAVPLDSVLVRDPSGCARRSGRRPAPPNRRAGHWLRTSSRVTQPDRGPNPALMIDFSLRTHIIRTSMSLRHAVLGGRGGIGAA